MKRMSFMRLVLGVFAVLSLSSEAATTTTKEIAWSLPQGWEDGVTYDEVEKRGGGGERFVDIYGGELSRRYGLGAVGEPDLPTLTVNVGVPDGGEFVSATLDAVEWAPVEVNGAIPIPIAEPVQYGAELVYPTPEKGAYEGVYPSKFVISGHPGVSGGVTMVPLTITPYKWDGATKTLYKAASLKVKITLQVKKTLRLSTSSVSNAKTNPNSAKARAMARTINPDDLETSGGLRLSTSSVTDESNKEIWIISPSDFVRHWEGYVAFRKNTDAGRDFKYTIVNTMDIYTNTTYFSKHCSNPVNKVRDDSVDALAIHHYIEKKIYDASKEQYIILGAAPTKVQYDRKCMIPARYVVNQNSYDQVCDMYYGYMDRYNASGAKIDPKDVTEDSPEVWDYDCDGYYMGSKNAGGGFTSDNNKYVDWEMDIPVTRVPMMHEYVEYQNGEHKITADGIMDHFTNNIAYAESEVTWDSTKSWRQVLGGGYLFSSYARGSQDNLVQGEHTFFDGGINYFDKNHSSPAPDAEGCPRMRQFDHYSYYRASRMGLINTGGLVTCPWGELYTNSGDCFDVHCHGWARGADPGTTGGALFATGLWRVFNMALPCESGMYDYYCKYNGVNQGYTNCCSMGEAPLLCFNPHAGGLVTFNNSRYGWWGGYNGMSSHMEGMINRAFYEQELNAGQACKWMHNNCTLKTTGSRGGACNLEVIMHGDPLIKISPQYNRTWNRETAKLDWTTNMTTGAGWIIAGKTGDQPFDYTKEMFVDAMDKGDITFNIIDDDLAAARLKMAGDKGQTITLGGNGKFRTTDSMVVTNANLKWNVAGGAGRNGIEFVGDPCDLTFEGSAARYVGYKVKNVRNLNVSGFNVIFDNNKERTAAQDFTVQNFSFIGNNDLAKETNGWYNVIRSRVQGFYPETMTIPVVSNRVELQTWNIGGGTADRKDKPLFFLTNAYLKVTYNPYWETEYFVRPTHLTDSHIVGEYDKFGFGRPDSNGYDLYVWGKSSIEGETPIMVTGELRIHLMDANAELEIANPMTDGHGTAGSIRVMGTGKVRIAETQKFTGGITIEDGAKLELAIAKAVKCNVTVQSGGELHLNKIPLDGVKTITLASGSRTYLAQMTGEGIYQMVDSSSAQVVRETGANIYDASNPTVSLSGIVSEGYFILSEGLIGWTGTSGTWKNDSTLTDNWRDVNDNPIGFVNTKPVVFGDQSDDVTVTVEGDVKPGFVTFNNPNSHYIFGGTGALSLESLASSYDVTYNVNLTLNSILKVVGGMATATSISAPLVEVANGGKLHMTGAITEPPRKIKAMKFSFSASMSSEKCAVQELRLFRGSTFFPLPQGTRIKDIAGQEIEIDGCSSYTHTFHWISTAPSSQNESLKALIDGTTSGGNKWWAGNSNPPTWFIITFPDLIDPVDGYSLCTADAGTKNRNPKTWSVSTSHDGDVFSQVSAVSDLQSTQSSYWLGSGDGTKANFRIESADGKLTVHNGSTLFADGKLALNLVLEAGATLAVTNSCNLTNTVSAAELTLPEAEGSVLVDASQAMVTSTAFPILCGYDISAADFLKFRCVSDTAVLNLKDGDLYIVTDGIKSSPYTATISETTGTTNWSQLAWTDGKGESFVWNNAVNYRTDGEATINLAWVDGKATTLNLDIGGALGKLALTGSATDAITLKWGAEMVPRTVNVSGYAGPVTLDYGSGSTYALGYSDFIAGKDTVIPSASSGSLTIGAGKRAIVPDWGDYTKISGAGTISISATPSSATWANDNRVTGTNELCGGEWEVKNTTDYPKNKEIKVSGSGVLKLTTVNDATGYGTYTTGLTIADGGEVQVAKRDTFNRVMTLHNGGKLTFTADVSDNNRVYDFFNNAVVYVTGVAPSMMGGSAAEVDPETGDKIKKSGIIALRRPSNFTVNVAEGSLLNVYAQWGGAAGQTYPWIKAGDGVMAFYRASEQTGNMTISAGAVRLVNKGQGTKGKIINQGELQVCASNNYEQTVDNVIQGTGGVRKIGSGTTVLSGVNTYSGLTTVEEGVLKLGNADALGASSVWMAGGVLDMGELRIPDYTVNASLDVAIAGGFKIRAKLTTEQSLGQVQLVKLGSFADDLTVGELKNIFEIYVGDEKLEPENYKIVLSGGIAEYQPDQLTGYAFPLETTANVSNDWTRFTWLDQEKIVFTNDWSEYPSATVKVKVEPNQSGLMTFSKPISTPRLTIENKGKYLEIGGGTGSFRVTGMVDAMGNGPGSVTFLNFDLGAANIDTGDGEVILLPNCTGTLNTEPGSIVTMTNGMGRGTAVLAAGSELRFLGTTAMNLLPWCSVDNRTGAWIGYGFPITTDEVAFGGVGEATRTDGNFHFQGNLKMVTQRFVTGNGSGTIERFKQTGGSIVVTGDGAGSTTTDSTVLLGHWPSTITWEQFGGTFTATNAPTIFGWDGKVDWTMTGGTTRLRGLWAKRVSDHDNTSSFTLGGEGRLEIGDLGITFTGRGTKNAAFTFAGGTLEAYANSAMAVQKGITVSSDSTIEADEGVLLTVDGAITGEGVLTAAGEGTVRFKGNCSAAKLAGKFQITVTEEQRTANTSSVLFTLPDEYDVSQVQVVDESGNPAEGGNGAPANGKYHWVPSGKYIQPITTTIGENVSWSALAWQDAAETALASSQLTSDMELELRVMANATLNVDTTATFALVRTTGTGELTIANSNSCKLTATTAEITSPVAINTGAAVITQVTSIPETGWLKVSSTDAVKSFASGVVFTGTFEANGFLPTWGVFADANRWHGTLRLTGNQTLAGEAKYFDTYGNANSVVDLNGTFGGYLKQKYSTTSGIRVTGTLQFSNGYSNEGGYKFNGPLSGAGTIKTLNSQSDVLAFIGDASQFRGTVNVAGKHCVSFGDQTDDGSCEGKISVLSTTPIIASNKTWQATGGIVVKSGGVLSVEYRSDSTYAAGTSIVVDEGGTLNLVRTSSDQKVFRVTSSNTLTLNGNLTLNGVQVPSWGYTKSNGTITLKDKAVCILPVTTTVSGAKNLTDLEFHDSSVPAQEFNLDELLKVANLEVNYTVEADSSLTVDTNVVASVVKVFGGPSEFSVQSGHTHTVATYDLSEATGTITINSSTGAGNVIAGKDTVIKDATDVAGTLTIGAGMKATVPTWPKANVALSAGGTLALTGGGTRWASDNAVSGATVDLTSGEFDIGCNGSQGGWLAVGAKLRVSGDAQVAITSDENGMKPNAILEIAGGVTTIGARFIMSQGGAGTSYFRMSGGEFNGKDGAGHLYVGGNNNSCMELDIAGGRFTAGYAPWNSNNQGILKCYGTTRVSGEGVFAPHIISMSDPKNIVTPVGDVAVTTYNHNLYLSNGGTYLAPGISPNWYAIGVTNGVGNIGVGEGVGVAWIKGPITVNAGCTLNVTNGTVKLNSAIQGEGTINVSEGATLDLNGISVYNVTGSGTVTNSSDTAAFVIYNTTVERNLTFGCNIKINNAYVNVDEYSQTIQIITKGNGIIAELNGVRVKVGGVINRSTWRLTDDNKGIIASESYHANLEETTDWDGGKGAGLKNHNTFVNENAILITNLADNATLTFNTDTTASGLRIVSASDKELTLNLSSPAPSTFNLGSYDFSEALGKVTLGTNPGGVSVTAGGDTVIQSGGTGTLTIPAGAKATVKGAFGGYVNEGTLRRDYDCSTQDFASFLQGDTSTTNGFKSVTLTGGMQTAKAVFQVLDGDNITFVGTSGNYGCRMTSSFDIQGGRVLVQSNQPDTWFGAPGVTVFHQSGGVFEATANNASQSGNVGFMFGYANKSEDLLFDISGGHFLVEHTSINFYDCPRITLSGTGLMRAKGVFKAKSYAEMAMSGDARFELGSLGWRQNSATFTMNGGTLSTFEDATMENAITLGGNAVIGAKAETTLTLNADVTGAHTLTIGNVASNDTGVVRANGSRFKCGALNLVAGTLEVPVGTLTNDIVFAGGVLNVTDELAGLAEYVITTGTISGDPKKVTFNGRSLAEAKFELVDNKLVNLVAIQPFHLDIKDADYSGIWTNAAWHGANEKAVTPNQWEETVCQAFVNVAADRTATLTVDNEQMVEWLIVTNRGTLSVSGLSTILLDDSASMGATTLDVTFDELIAGDNTRLSRYDSTSLVIDDGKKVTMVDQAGASCVDDYLDIRDGGELNIACGTRMNPFTILSSKAKLSARKVTIAEDGVLRLQELSTGSGNRIWTIAGEGGDKSTLILATERGLGFNAGSNFTSLTLVVDAADKSKKTYLEQRSASEVLTDASVDLVITNNSIVVVDGSSSYSTIVNVGNLSGNGEIPYAGYHNGTLGVNLHSDSTFGGTFGIPVIVSGSHTLTLTQVNTGAITVTNGATVKLALAAEAVHTAALSGNGTVEVASGTLQSAGNLSCALKIDASGKFDITHDLADEFTLSTQSITFSEGASVTNNVTANGVALQGDWTIEGGTIRRTLPTTPFVLAPTDESDWTAANWKGANNIPVMPNDWASTVAAANITVGEGTNVTLAVDRDLTITTLNILGAGRVDVDNRTHTLTADSTVIEAGSTLTMMAGPITASKITNNGTLNFQGGTEANPIAITGDGNLGVVTLGENTHVKNDDGGTARTYVVTGSGPTSFYTIARNGTGSPGMANATPKPNSFANVVILSAATGNNNLWLEHANISETVGLKASGNIVISDLTPNPVVIRSLTGTATLSRSGSQELTIKNLEDADFAGTSGLAITIASSDCTQTFSGNYTGALTVNGKVALTGNANPSAITLNANSELTIDSTKNLTIATADTTSVISKAGSGNLTIGANRPTFKSITDGKVVITASDDELLSGHVQFKYTGDTESLPAAERFTINGTTPTGVTYAEGVLSLGVSASRVTESTTMSAAESGKSGILIIDGTAKTENEPLVFTFDKSHDAAITKILVRGWVMLTADGVNKTEAQLNDVEFDSNCQPIFGAAPNMNTYTVAAGKTVTYIGGADAAHAFNTARAVSVSANGTLKTRGYVKLTSTSNVTMGSSTLKVQDGTLEFTCANQGINGNLTVEAGATYVNKTNDSFKYSGGGASLTLKGTYDGGTTRVLARVDFGLTLYTGAVINGTGDGQGCAFDYFNDAGNIIVEKSTASGVIVNAPFRFQTGTTTIQIKNNADIEFHGALIGAGSLTKNTSGNSTMALYGANTLSGTITLAAGYLSLMPGSSYNGPITANSGTALDLGGSAKASRITPPTSSAQVVLTKAVTNNGRIDVYGDAKISGAYSGNGAINTGVSGATADSTFTLVGSSTSIGGTVTINANSAVRLEGTGAINTFTLNANGKLLVAESGSSWTTTRGASNYMGNLTIGKGATFTINAGGDGGNTTFNLNVYGTLVLNNRFCIKGGATMNFYAGSTLAGTGDGTWGAMDGYGADCTYNFLDDDDDPTTPGMVTITAPFRCRQYQVGVHNFNVAEGVTVDFQGAFPHQNTGSGEGAAQSIVKTGLGTMKFSTVAKTFKEDFSVNAGKLVCDVQPFTDTTKTLTIATGATLDVSGFANASIAKLTLNTGSTVKPCANGLTVGTTFTKGAAYHIDGSAVLTDEEDHVLMTLPTGTTPDISGVTVNGSDEKIWGLVVDGNLIKATYTPHVDAHWDASSGKWKDGQGQEITDFSNVILRFKDGDVVTFSSLTAPYAATMPTTGTVTITNQNNLVTGAIDIPTDATLVLASNAQLGITNVVGTGTLAYDPGNAAESATAIAADKLAAFTGTLWLKSGRHGYSAAIASAVAIKVTDGSQFYISGGTWNNAFTLSGQGYRRTDKNGKLDYAALRLDGTLGASAVVTFEFVDKMPGFATHSGGTINGTLQGCGFRKYGNGDLKLGKPKTNATKLTSDIVVDYGTLTIGNGNNSSCSAGDEVTIGTGKIIVNNGAKLAAWCWTTVKETALTTDKIKIMTPITLNSGAQLNGPDGAHAFMGAVTVNGTASGTFAYHKGWAFNNLNIPSGSTFNATCSADGSYNVYFSVLGGNVDGTLNVTNDGGNNKEMRVCVAGDALADGTLNIQNNGGNGAFVYLVGNATLGTVTGNALAAFGDGTTRTLTLTGGTYTMNFKDIASGKSDSARLNLVVTGEVTLNGSNTANVCSGTTTVTADGALTIGNATALPTGLLTANGILNLGQNRPTCTIARASTGTINLQFTQAEDDNYVAGTDFNILKFDSAGSFDGTINAVGADGTTIRKPTFAVIEDPSSAGTYVLKIHNPNPVAADFPITANASQSVDDIAKLSWVKANGAPYVDGFNNIDLTAGTVIITNTSDSVEEVVIPVTTNNLLFSTFKFVNAKANTLTVRDAGSPEGGVFTATTIDDTGSTGPTEFDVNFNVGTLHPGADTTVSGSGTIGTLSVAAGKKATLDATAPTISTIQNVAGGTVRYAGERGEVTMAAAMPTAGNYEFENATLTGTMKGSTYANRKLVVPTGDAVIVAATADGGYMCADMPFDVKGGSLTYAQATHQWFYANTYSISDGTVTINANGDGSGTQKSVIFGYSGGASTINVSGGVLDISKTAMWFDGANTINLSGNGVLLTKGFKKSNNSNAIRINVSDTSKLLMGSIGLASLNNCQLNLNGGTLKAYETTTVANAITVGGAATFAATNDTTMTIENLTVGAGGTITVGGEGTVFFKNYRGPLTLEEGSTAKVGFVVNINDCGEFTPPEGVAPERVELYKADGTKITTKVEGGKLTYTWEIEGKECWWDYEFNGNVTSVGTDTTTMSEEGTTPFYNTENTALWVGHATHYRGATYPYEFTAVLHGKMVSTQGQLEIGFGSTTAGTKINVSIACGNPDDEEVKLLISEAYTVKKTVLMSVPNAYTADHLYAFVYKTVNEGGTEKSKVIVYLDGVEWDSYTFSGKLLLGGGFQIGSVHGGAPSGYAKATTVNANSFLNFLRVYQTVLGQAAMTKYAALYPYTSTNGNATRTFNDATATWTAENAWNVTPAEGAAYTSNMPPAKAMVTIDASIASTVTFDLNETATYEQLRINGNNPITLKTGGTVKPTVSGLTTIDANVTNDWDAIGYGNVMVKEGKSLTFDFTNYPFTNCFATTTINLTGKPSGTGTFAAIIPELHAGRTAELRTNPDSGHYELLITVTPQPFIYTIAEGGTGAWTWGTEQPVTEAVVDSNASIPIQKNGTGTLEKALVNNRGYTVHEGTFKPTTANGITATVIVDAGATYDCNGKSDGYITFVLNGGALVNNNGEISHGSRQINGISLMADSTLGGASNFGMVSGGYAANTLDLGGHKLTKNGANTFWLCSTTVTNGTLEVASGTVKVTNGAVTFKNDAQLVLKSGATLDVDNNSLTIGTIQAANATIHNGYATSPTSFRLEGSATLTGSNGNWGTITNAENAVATVGTKHDFTFAGAGSVNAQLSVAYAPGDVVTVFLTEAGATTKVGELKDKDGNVIDASRYTSEGGVVTFKKEASIGTTIYFTLNEAVQSVTSNDTMIVLLDSVAIGDKAMTIPYSITLLGEEFTLSGAGFAEATDKTLTIASGFINVTSLGERYALIGGKYSAENKAKWSAAEGYHYVEMAAIVGDYSYQIVKGADDPLAPEKAYPVVQGETVTGTVALNEKQLEKIGCTSETPVEDVSDALASRDTANHNTKYENLVLGLSNDVATDIPVPAPVQTKDADRVTFKLDNVEVDETTGARVTYVVKAYDSLDPSAEVIKESATTWYTETAAMELPSTGVRYYKIEVFTTPAK